MPKVQAWSAEDFKKNLAKRLKYAKKYRENLVEEQWRRNERCAFYWNGRSPAQVTLTDDNLTVFEDASVEGTTDTPECTISFAWKFLRFIQSQMSANPPSVIARPTSTDPSDREKADAADRIARHAYQDKDMQEVFDLANLKCLTYGTGWIKVVWDADAGDTFDFEQETGNLIMTGDILVYSPSTWDVWIDPDARTWRDCRYVFERIEMPVEEAHFRWSAHKEEIDKFVKKRHTDVNRSEIGSDFREGEEIVEVYAYTEKGLPINGTAGRQAFCLEDGTVLGKPTKNQNPGAVLGYAMETDVDIPDQVYGASFIQWIERLQDLLSRLDTSIVENVAAHGVVRFILPEGCEIEEESLSNSSWDYVKITGNAGTGPYFVDPAQLMPDIHRLRENLISGMQELAGVNDAMFGKTNREVSGFSLQTMISAGSEIRRRLFNKYTLMVRDVYRMYLANARTYWSEPRTIVVLGKEKAFESAEFSSADVNGGYDFHVEYGASLSLDPARRREEIMQLLPHFEKAQLPTKTILRHLRLNELENLYDRMEVSGERMKEIISEMLAKHTYIPPRELQDHAGMLDYAYSYLMSSDFKYLPEEDKELVEQHVREREQLAAKGAAPAGGAAPVGGAAGDVGAAAQPALPGPGGGAAVEMAPAFAAQAPQAVA